jgi:hypothetical protein
LGFTPAHYEIQKPDILATPALKTLKLFSMKSHVTDGQANVAIFIFPIVSNNNMSDERICEAGVTLLGSEVTYSFVK